MSPPPRKNLTIVNRWSPNLCERIVESTGHNTWNFIYLYIWVSFGVDVYHI